MYSVRNIISLLLSFCLVSFQLQSIFAAALLFSDDPYQPDDKIILKNVWEERNPLKKIKYTMLAYARPTVDIMKVTARKIITSFYELENFDATEYYMRIPTTNQRKKRLIDIVLKLWDQIQLDLISRKSTLSYTQHVFYYKILKLFSEKISRINDLSQLKEKVNEEIKKFHNQEGTIMPIWDKFNTVADLKKDIISDTDKCIEIFSKIQSSGMHGITSTNIDYSIPQSCDEELQRSDDKMFKKTSPTGNTSHKNNTSEKFTPHQMLVYVHYVANVKKNDTFKRIPIEKIRVNYKMKSLTLLKNGLLLYYEALNEKFWKTIKPEDDAYEVISESINYGIKPIPLENYSEAFILLNSFEDQVTAKELRAKSLIALYESILHEADRKMRLLKVYLPELRKKKSRVMYYKLLQWLKDLFLEDLTSIEKVHSVKFQDVIKYIGEIQTREAEEIGQMEEVNIGRVDNFRGLIEELNRFDRDDLDAGTSNTIINPLEDDQNLGRNDGTSHNSNPEPAKIDHSSINHPDVTNVSSEQVLHEGNDGTTVNSTSAESPEISPSSSNQSNVHREEGGSLPSQANSSLPSVTPPISTSADSSSSSDSVEGSGNSITPPHEGDDQSSIQPHSGVVKGEDTSGIKPNPSEVESDPVITASSEHSHSSHIQSSGANQG